MKKINLWLDDIRPPLSGYVWVKTVAEAKPYLEKGLVKKSILRP